MNILFAIAIAAIVLAFNYLTQQLNWTNVNYANQPGVNNMAESLSTWYWAVDNHPSYYSGSTQSTRLATLSGYPTLTLFKLAIGSSTPNSWLIISYATAVNTTQLVTGLRFRLANLANVYVATNSGCTLSYLNYIPATESVVLNTMFSSACSGSSLLTNIVLLPLNESI